MDATTQIEQTEAQRAVAAIVDLFNDPTERVNRQTGEITISNRLGFAQRQMLNRLATSVHYAVEAQVEYVDGHREKVKGLIRQSDGTEISLNNIEREGATLETAELGLAAMNALFAELVRAHDAIARQPWSKPAARASKQANDVDARLAALQARFGVEIVTGGRTNGTQGDETESAAVVQRNSTGKAKLHAAE